MEAAKAIKIVGWTWVVIGCGMILSGVFGAIFLFVVFQRMFPPDFNTDLIPHYDLLMWFRWAYPFQFLVGIFVLVCGRQILKRQEWPRKYLEGFSWFFLAFSIVWSFVMAFIIFRIEGDLMGLFAIPVMAPYVALFGFLVYQLRSGGVREALDRLQLS
ncbi:MAG: hypothetical protein KC994_26435 [Candidatus Omnitrophica bacterium]|nr:hypothetical protein [Candidatus Omnitrophota bacterium]